MSTSDLPPYEPARLLGADFPERVRLVCRSWASQVNPTPKVVMAMYWAKYLLVYVGVVLVIEPNSEPGREFMRNLPAFATYTSNWLIAIPEHGERVIFYFAWSLATEEQFYLLWPLLFAAGMRSLRRGGMLFASCAGAAAAALLMAQLYQPDGDPSRVYYGTDTRTAGFLAGAALALAQVRRPSPPNPLSQAGRGGDPAPTWRRKGPWDGSGAAVGLVLDCFGLIALGALAWQVVDVDETLRGIWQVLCQPVPADRRLAPAPAPLGA